jgi:uncharacterized protein YbbK (DUF523 family)
LGHTSKKRYISFFRVFDLLGITNRIMCMRSPDCGSPFNIMERIFFYEGVNDTTLETARARREGVIAP